MPGWTLTPSVRPRPESGSRAGPSPLSSPGMSTGGRASIEDVPSPETTNSGCDWSGWRGRPIRIPGDALRARSGEEDAFKTLLRVADNEAGLDAQPPASLVLLARLLTEIGADRRAENVLRRAHQKHPGDYWVNYELAFARGADRDRREQPVLFPRPEEAVRDLVAAASARSGSAFVRFQLGNALVALSQGQPGCGRFSRGGAD